MENTIIQHQNENVEKNLPPIIWGESYIIPCDILVSLILSYFYYYERGRAILYHVIHL